MAEEGLGVARARPGRRRNRSKNGAGMTRALAPRRDANSRAHDAEEPVLTEHALVDQTEEIALRRDDAARNACASKGGMSSRSTARPKLGPARRGTA